MMILLIQVKPIILNKVAILQRSCKINKNYFNKGNNQNNNCTNRKINNNNNNNS